MMLLDACFETSVLLRDSSVVLMSRAPTDLLCLQSAAQQSGFSWHAVLTRFFALQAASTLSQIELDGVIARSVRDS